MNSLFRNLLIASGLFGVSTLALENHITSRAQNAIDEVKPPIGSVSIIIPTYNEEALIENCLRSIRAQNILAKYPDYFEVIVVDSYSSDATVEKAKRYVDRIIFAPRGKLNARDLGIRNANGEIIVSVDADVFAPVNWLNLLLRHFRCPRDNCRWSSVVAVSGPTIGEYGALDSLYLWRFLLYGNSPLQLKRLYGRNSAFRREAYFLANGFNLEVDQFDLNSIINEEEFNFARRLSELGKYVFDLQASVFTQNRRIKCKDIDVETYDVSDPLCRYCREIEEGERF
ncbi:MAG: glycosyltransferase family 2 protein [Methanocellales archaeon]